MKSLVKKLANTDFGILIRNSFNFKPINFKHHKKKFPRSVSDAFLWRTDNGYKTIFKYSRKGIAFNMMSTYVDYKDEVLF